VVRHSRILKLVVDRISRKPSIIIPGEDDAIIAVGDPPEVGITDHHLPVV